MRDVHPLPGHERVVNGVRLHVVQHGTGPGLPLLLLHGIPTSSYLWRDVQRDLEHQHATYAPDLVGLGRSERPLRGRYALADQARLMVALLDALDIERVGVVGHDVGGGVAAHLAALAPARVAALVLIDAPVHADTWPVPAISSLRVAGLGGLQTRLLRLLPAVGRRYLSMQLGRGLRATALDPRVVDHYAADLLTADGTEGLRAFARALDPAAVEAAFRQVAAAAPPTLVVWAESDVWHPTTQGRRVAADIPGAAYVEIADAGHFLPEDRPERVAEEIAGFCVDLPASQSADQ